MIWGRRQLVRCALRFPYCAPFFASFPAGQQEDEGEEALEAASGSPGALRDRQRQWPAGADAAGVRRHGDGPHLGC